jgi:hypothetical protein
MWLRLGTSGGLLWTRFGLHKMLEISSLAVELLTYQEGPLLISNLMYKILIYLYIIHLLKSSTCFEHYPAHLQEVYVVIVYMQPLVSSLSAGDCPVHRFLTGAQDSHLQTVTIPEAAYIQLRRRPPEDEQDNARNM